LAQLLTVVVPLLYPLTRPNTALMNLEKVFICDIECNALLNEGLNRLHVLSLSWKEGKEWPITSTKDPADIERLLSNPDHTIVGHYFLGFDLPALKQLYPHIEVKASFIDSLSLSHYLFNERPEHSLESWGETLGFPKVHVDDEEWETMTYERAKERCEQDVLITRMLWGIMLNKLRQLYGTDEEILPVIRRANWKITLQHIQSKNKILIDLEQCHKNLAFLEEIIQKKTVELESIMPKVPITRMASRPKITHKKGGLPSAHGIKWFELLKERGLPMDHTGEIEVITGYTKPNCSSHTQMKEFLFSMGWKPLLFKDGANGKVPQLRDDEKNLCASVTKLIEIHPQLEALDGLSVAQHRAGYLKGFISKADPAGYVTASWSGMAKTWRVKHVAPIVNLPANNAAHGNLVRSVMIAPEGKVWVNADLASLEDKTKQVCIYQFDPEYVETLNTPGYDAHLSIALKARFLDEAEVAFYKWYKQEDRKTEDIPESYAHLMNYEDLMEGKLKEEFNRINKIRQNAKVVNYASTYSAQPKRLAEIADISIKEATAMHTAYWETNKSIKQFVDTLRVKTVDNRKWIYSPFTKLWLLLSSDHMKFSAVNQNFGSCVFDLLCWYLVDAGYNPILTMHDELAWYINEGEEEDTKQIVQQCVEMVNEAFKYPIRFESKPEFAKSYGLVH